MQPDDHRELYTRKKWEDTKSHLYSLYPGNSPIINNHIEKAAVQLLHGQVIGRRETPVVSFWLMRDKWLTRGVSWVCGGSDGDVFMGPHGLVYPAILQLAYFKTRDNLVCQLAYVVDKETTKFRVTPIYLPTIIEREYTYSNVCVSSVSSASDEIYNAMAQII